MADPYGGEREALIATVTRGPGSLAPEIRAALVDRAKGRTGFRNFSPLLAEFADAVTRDAPVITDADVTKLLDHGFDEEAIFEAAVAAALGASLVRLERVDMLLRLER